MKNPAKPGDFGTNGTRDVVGSGMSETTKRALNADLIDLSIPWHKRVDRAHLIAAPVANTPPRPSRLTAEGGVGDFTPTRSGDPGTASEAQTSRENRTACTGRKTALNWVEVIPLSLCPLAVASVAACLILSHGSALSVACGPAFVAFCALIAVLWKMARGRTSGGGTV